MNHPRTYDLAQRLTMKDEAQALAPSKLSDTEIRMLALDVMLLVSDKTELIREREEARLTNAALIRQALWTSEAIQRAVDEIAEKSADEIDAVALYEHLCVVLSNNAPLEAGVYDSPEGRWPGGDPESALPSESGTA